ncbi:hypothetical protein [Magnetospirillum sp. 64-120]|uniref:hypothetical protein n=1 Tax=Magnetospirillum sp. 64-120 TaxID=1895778 RepID=UPI000929004D|nr:hypothetical protein [Magnetospirillum sp. 64-120]OJX77462.1 MAG: hypothetical protein BGO92_10565 [Magnetospirillum sp. 64-120]
MDTLPAWRIEAGRFVFAELDGVRTLCLKAERQGKDHVNHFLVALEPLPRRDAMGLCYLDPDQPLSPAEGFSLTFTASAGDAQVGDVLETEAGLWLKLLDAQSSQRLYCFVNLAQGQIKPRLDRHRHQKLDWHLQRI